MGVQRMNDQDDFVDVWYRRIGDKYYEARIEWREVEPIFDDRVDHSMFKNLHNMEGDDVLIAFQRKSDGVYKFPEE